METASSSPCCVVGLGLAGLLLLEWRGEMVGCLCSDSRDSLNNDGKELERAAGEFFLGLDRDWGVFGRPLLETLDLLLGCFLASYGLSGSFLTE